MWIHTQENKQSCSNIPPPLEGLNIPYVKDVLQAAPFKKPSESKGTTIVTVEDIKKVFEQNKYTNQVLLIVSKQIEDSKYN